MVDTCVLPPAPVLVTTLGAPLILPALAAPRSALIALSRLTMLELYALGTLVSQPGADVAVRADSMIAPTEPVTEAADAAE